MNASFRMIVPVLALAAAGQLFTLHAQNKTAPAPTAAAATATAGATPKAAKELIVAAPPAAYRLGPGDQLRVWALGVDEAAQQPVRIDPSGFVELPMIGRVHAEGRTTDELRADLVERLKTYVRQPQVTVNVTEYGSQPVSVVGSVNKVGSLQLEGPKTLIEVVSLAGGLKDDAGNKITVTRSASVGAIPLPHTRQDHSGQFSSADIPVRDLFNGTDPALNIAIMPHDVISVERGHVVYVMGQVRKPGGFNIGDRPQLTLLEALGNAEGVTSMGAPQNARILRITEGLNRKEIPVDAREILRSKKPDIALEPEDIVVIPDNTPKNIAIKAIETAVNIGSGITIWRVGYAAPR